MARYLAAGLALTLAACSVERPEADNQAKAEPAPALAPAGAAANEAEPGQPAPPVRSDRSSRFTTLSDATCKLVEENREEAGYWRRDCAGAGGFRLQWSESDLRQELAIVSGSRTDRLSLSRLVTNGAFDTIGKTVEWRGDPGQSPDRLVARVNVADAANPQGPDISKLIVVRLAPSACIVAIVDPGPDQSSAARRVADDDDRSSCLPG
ncbi:hypothetical protein H8M03_09760 [Sphingomonas sabuli]|uniref:Uncharacterized protein n=1 Tax=Sphingomonas sabuli TaxID=2764186 RepID=A0A7G9L0Z8_9SPHN|nr:hypothetical protein [Sphingomonas sabuli]QNM82297.1 hypothetical protein H8M03_09760 [Sphingomonas sabuli]